MSNVIQFLELLGRSPRALTDAEYASATISFEAPARDALLARDPISLAAALHARATVACVIAIPENDEPAPEDVPFEGDEPPADSDVKAA
ncbi:hypothetical protein ACFFGH_00240 [Lysobacter korlensis]|uniref:Uncharacterized protein n=1 Tax=Lysobacter korlensis TaxID=553636 RepID=A0ABV6RHN9_9GAMM